MKKLVMMVVLNGIVLLCYSQWSLACSKGEVGVAPMKSLETWLTEQKSLREKILIAIRTADIDKVKKLLKAGAHDFCRNTGKGYIPLRLTQNESCESPSDIALELGYPEVAQIIMQNEENNIRVDMYFLITFDYKMFVSYLKYYKQSQWFHSKLPEFIAYAEKFENFEAAQLLKEFQAQH